MEPAPDVQCLVDGLAAELGRPVGVDDRRFHALAYSAHSVDVDRARLVSILRRRAPAPVVAWLESLEVMRDVAEFARVPANVELGLLERVCVAVRSQGLLLGYLWLIDVPRIGDDEIGAASRCAAEVGNLLYRRRIIRDAERRRASELVRLLLTGDDAARAVAGEQLAGSAAFEPSACVGVVAVRAAEGAEAALTEPARTSLAKAVDDVRRALPPRRLGAFVDAQHAVALVACPEPAELQQRARLILERAAGQVNEPLVAGVSSARARLADAPAAYREAVRAAGLAAAVPGVGPLAAWPRLGAYRTIARLAAPGAPGDAVPASLARLLACPDANVLVDTLTEYLERAGDAKATAAALYVHRSSLYNRLRRIEEIAGVDLTSGDGRLELHLGLRLWRMSGRSAGTAVRPRRSTPVEPAPVLIRQAAGVGAAAGI